MDSEPISEIPPKPVSDWIILRREWSDLTRSPFYELFKELASELTKLKLAKLQPVYLFSSSPVGLEKEMEETFQKVKDDNPLNGLRDAICASYQEEGNNRPYPRIVRVLKYNQGPDGYEHDELYVMSGRDGSEPFIEFGHHEIKRGGDVWSNVNRINPDEPQPGRQEQIQIAREIFADSPVYTQGGEEFSPLITR